MTMDQQYNPVEGASKSDLLARYPGDRGARRGDPAAATLGGEVRTSSPVESALSTTYGMSAKLAELIEDLEKRLQPVLGPATPTTERAELVNGNKTQRGGFHILTATRSIEQVLGGAINRASSLLTRLEV